MRSAVEPFEFTTTKKKEQKTGTHTLALFRCARQRNFVTEPKIVSTFAEITEWMRNAENKRFSVCVERRRRHRIPGEPKKNY